MYVALNTLLRDDELPDALDLILRLAECGADAVIIQDMGLLELPLPPLPRIASTQCDNATPEKIAFLEKVGFQRAILARELSLHDIAAIKRAAPGIELECFVHGALCVCRSGQCYLSYASGGRSGNRGRCAQPCRKPYSLVDAGGRVLARRRHLLSLRDLNLSDYLGELIDAGASSLKIEGRLKDAAYVANIVAFYRSRLDEVLQRRGLRRASSGAATAGFLPNPDKTFNRGFTAYFIHGPARGVGAHDTPKMRGEEVGRVASVDREGVLLESAFPLRAGDGVCWFDQAGELRGAVVNAASDRRFVPENRKGISKGTVIFRNFDHAFFTTLRKSRPVRRIAVTMRLSATADRVLVVARDEDGVEGACCVTVQTPPAKQADAAVETIRRQLAKTGGGDFVCQGVEIEPGSARFIPIAKLNALRRAALNNLSLAREAARPRPRALLTPNAAPYPADTLTFEGNVLNRKAEAFYRRHGVHHIEPAAESGLDLRGRRVMTLRYCLRRELGLCAGKESPAPQGKITAAPPLYLIDDAGQRLELRFACDRCEMEVWLEANASADQENRLPDRQCCSFKASRSRPATGTR